MRIHNTFLLLATFSITVLFFSCTSDPKIAAAAETENTPEVLAEAIAAPVAPAPTAEEIAAVEAAKVAAEKEKQAELKAAKKKERAEAASKERRRKRRERRKKRAAEKAAAEKLAKKEAAKAASQNTATSSNITMSSPVTQSSIPQEDLSDVDPDLLEIVQVKSTGGTPNIRFDSESFNFGRIIQGEEIDHQFQFTNTGSAPLVINNVEVTCGCTTPFYPFIPIEPGERGKIDVHFSSKGRLGNQSPTITVYTNTDSGIYELSLEGIIDTERADQ